MPPEDFLVQHISDIIAFYKPRPSGHLFWAGKSTIDPNWSTFTKNELERSTMPQGFPSIHAYIHACIHTYMHTYIHT